MSDNKQSKGGQMTQFTIDIEKYLSEEDIRQMVRDATFQRIDKYVRGQGFNLSDIVANVAYVTVKKAVEEQCDETLEEMIAKKMPSVVEDMSPFLVFRGYDDRQQKYSEWSKGAELLEKAVEANADKINARVTEIIGDLSFYDLKAHVDDAIYETIIRWTSEKDDEGHGY